MGYLFKCLFLSTRKKFQQSRFLKLKVPASAAASAWFYWISSILIVINKSVFVFLVLLMFLRSTVSTSNLWLHFNRGLDQTLLWKLLELRFHFGHSNILMHLCDKFHLNYNLVPKYNWKTLLKKSKISIRNLSKLVRFC